jgi:hypothetical protein
MPPSRGAIIISDRMITAGDQQYEPPQQKLAKLTPRVLVMVAGEVTLHSQAIIDARAQLTGATTLSRKMLR